MRKARARYRREVPELRPDMLAALAARDWPGNVRELRNIADRLVLGVMTPQDLLAGANEAMLPGEGSLAEQVSAFERAVISRTLEANDGRLKPTYESLGISRKTLYDKIRKYGLDSNE